MAGLKRSLVTEPTKHVAAPTIAAVAQKNQSSSRSNHPKTCSANIIALAASAPSAVHTERRHRTDVDGTSKYKGTSTRTHTGRMKKPHKNAERNRRVPQRGYNSALVAVCGW